MLEEELHALGINRLLGGVNHSLQHEVRLFQLIVEEQVGLRVLHRQRVGALCKIGTQHVQSAEHPATSTRLLVVNRLLLGFYTEIGIQVACIVLILRQIVNGIRSNGIAQCLISRLGCILAFHLLHHLLRDAATCRLGCCCQSQRH